jgi:WD40 repeat protein
MSLKLQPSELENRLYANLVEGKYTQQMISVPSNDFAVTDDGCIVSYSEQKIRVYSNEGELKNQFPLSFNTITHLISLPKQRILVVDSKAPFQIFDLETGESLGSFSRKDASASLRYALPIETGKLFAGYNDGKIIVWDLEKNERLKTFKIEQSSLYQATLTPDQKKWIVGLHSGKIFVQDLEGKTKRHTFLPQEMETELEALICSTQTNRLIVACESRYGSKFSIYDLNENKLLSTVGISARRFQFIASIGDLLFTRCFYDRIQLQVYKENAEGNYELLQIYSSLESSDPTLIKTGQLFTKVNSNTVSICNFSASNSEVLQDIAKEFTISSWMATIRFQRLPDTDKKPIYDLSGGEVKFNALSSVEKGAKIEEYLLQLTSR